MRVYGILTTLLLTLVIKLVLKIEINALAIQRIFHYKTNRGAMTVLRSVVKHQVSG